MNSILIDGKAKQGIEEKMKNRVHLKTRDEIVSFFKILAEESVKSARESLETDDKQEQIVKKIKSGANVFKNIYEQPVAGNEEEAEAAETEDTEESEEVEAEVEPAPEGSQEEIEVSLDSISDTIKQLRSGRSVDDSQIKLQLRAYFDRLDSLERKALLAFLRAFSGILTGASQGDNAPDPSDPPYSVQMTGQGEETEEVEDDIEAEVEEDPPEEEVEVEEEDEEAEDISPPIKVGESARLDNIRKTVLELMNR
jgi:hypothetical protein